MVDVEQLKGLSAEQLHEVTLRLIDGFAEQQRLPEAKDRSIETLTREITFKSTKVDQLTHELAQYKRLRFGKRSEKLDAAQASLLEETLDADSAAIEEELKQLRPPPKTENKQQPRRTPPPANLPRVDIHHEPGSTTCMCGCALKRIGEDVAEKLDYVPGVFTVERHVRGKWACVNCKTLIPAPVPDQVIDKGILTAGLLAQGWWPSTPTTCRCTVRKRSSGVPAWKSRDLRSVRGSAPVVYACNHGSMRSRKPSSLIACCMLMRRR